VKIEEALKVWLIENQHEFVEQWESSGWLNTESGTYWAGSQHFEFNMEALLNQIDIFSKQFKEKE